MSPKRVIDLEEVRRGDAIRDAVKRRNPNVRLPTEADLREANVTPSKARKAAAPKRRGRPKGVPSFHVMVRMPAPDLARLDAYCQGLSQAEGRKVSRAEAIRRCIDLALSRETL